MREKRNVNLAAAYDADDDGDGQEMTFAVLARAFAAVSSNRDEANRLEPWSRQLGERSAWSITTHGLARGIEKMHEAGYSAGYCNRVASTIGSMYRWAHKKRLCPRGFRSPTLGLKRYEELPRRVTFDPELIERLRARAQAVRDRRFGALISALIDSGARKSEILQRCWADIDLDAGVITLPPDSSKTGVGRPLFLSKATCDLFRRVWPNRPAQERPFQSRRGQGAVDFKKSLHAIGVEVGLPGIRFHDLRHHAAATLLKRGVGVGVAAQVLGHGVDVLTKRYGHLDAASLEPAARKLHGTERIDRRAM
jgi:integrase